MKRHVLYPVRTEANKKFFLDMTQYPVNPGKTAETRALRSAATVHAVDVFDILPLVGASFEKYRDRLITATQLQTVFVKVGCEVLQLNIDLFTEGHFGCEIGSYAGVAKITKDMVYSGNGVFTAAIAAGFEFTLTFEFVGGGDRRLGYFFVEKSFYPELLVLPSSEMWPHFEACNKALKKATIIGYVISTSINC